MTRIPLLFLLLFAVPSGAQNIYSALHLNENRNYKTVRPKRIIETNIFYTSSGIKQERHILSFDNAGMVISAEHYDGEGRLTGKSTNTNDTTNRIITFRAHERRERYGVSKGTTQYHYDSSHFLVRITEKNAFGVITGTTEIVNNEKGLPVEMIVFDANGQPYGKETAEYAYDRNRAITSVYSTDGRKLSTDSIIISFRNAFQFPDDNTTYNEQGDVIASSSGNLNGSVTNYEHEYIYDEFGNCLEEKIYKVTIRPNGKKKKEINREFKKQYLY